MSPKEFRKISHPEPKILNSLVNCTLTHWRTDGRTAMSKSRADHQRWVSLKLGAYVYQSPVTMSESKSRCHTPVRNLQPSPEPQIRSWRTWMFFAGIKLSFGLSFDNVEKQTNIYQIYLLKQINHINFNSLSLVALLTVKVTVLILFE